MMLDALTIAAYVVAGHHPRPRSRRASLMFLPGAIDPSAYQELGDPGGYECQVCGMVWDWPLTEPIAHRQGCAYLAALRVLRGAA